MKRVNLNCVLCGALMLLHATSLHACMREGDGIAATIKAYLSGPFTAGGMTTGLNTAGHIPLYSGEAYDPFVYHYVPKSVPSIPNANVVDWVIVELRGSQSPTDRIETQTGFILKVGEIVGTDGISPLLFETVGVGSYYVVVRHRNHLPVMSAAPVTVHEGLLDYDFTTAQSKAYGEHPMAALSGGVYGMHGGDANRDGIVAYSGNANDRLEILRVTGLTDALASVSGYFDADLNMNGNVRFGGSANDRAVLQRCVGYADPTMPIISQVPDL
ncbi:MAG TPA: hypothetical protein VK470_14135 [Bacteroidota bacterium]|nr:hypothetical protein [Bacteroidota bacterium]